MFRTVDGKFIGLMELETAPNMRPSVTSFAVRNGTGTVKALMLRVLKEGPIRLVDGKVTRRRTRMTVPVVEDVAVKGLAKP